MSTNPADQGTNKDQDFFADESLDLLTEEKTRLKYPKMYCVVMLNDDYTPMDFVILVIQKIFNKDTEEATHLMLGIHNQGSARIGTYTYDIAQTRIEQVHSIAKEHQHPLQCIIEVEEGNEKDE